jgi:hypothetical protein
MDAELEKHEGEKAPPYPEIGFDELLGGLRHHADRLHWALQARLKARNPDELKRAIEEIKRYAVHVGNYAMFVHDNAAMGRSN